jgi:hypothetical protein
LPLNLLDLERLRLGERCILRAGAAYICLRTLVVVLELADFLLQRFGLLRRMRSAKQLHLRCGLRVELQSEISFTIDQGGIHAFAYVRSRFGKKFEHPTRPSTFARLNRERIKPPRRICLVKPHKEIDIKVAVPPNRRKVGCARLLKVNV